MATVTLLFVFIGVLVLSGWSNALPLKSHRQQSPYPGTACNDVDEVISNDPCKPLCTCKDGKLFCAEISCSQESLPADQNCKKVPTNGKCCPSFICFSLTDNGTAEMHYPLPQLYLPPELGLSNSKS